MQKRSRSRWTHAVVALTVAIPAGVSEFVARYGAGDAANMQSFPAGGGNAANPMVDGVRAGGLAAVLTFVGLFLLLEAVMAVMRRRRGGDRDKPAED